MKTLISPVFIDHLRVAFRGPVIDAEAVMGEWFADHFAESDDFALDEVELLDSGPAGNFSAVRTWRWRGHVLFRVFVAGKTTRGVSHLIVDGQACGMVRPEAFPDLAGIGERRCWVIKRVDLAADDDTGRFTLAACVEAAYDAGLFDSTTGGPRRVIDPRDPRRGGAPVGWCVYVGDRKGRFYLRVYQKHQQVLSVFGAAAASAIPEQRVRFELEVKPGDKGAPLPWDILRDPAAYFASHSPALAERAEGVTPRRIDRVARDLAEAQLWTLLGHCRNSYGAAISQAFWSLGGDDQAAVQLLTLLRRTDAPLPVPGVAEVVGGSVPDRDHVPQD